MGDPIGIWDVENFWRRWGDGGDLLGVWGVEKYWEKFGDGNEGFFVFGALILKSVYKKTTH